MSPYQDYKTYTSRFVSEFGFKSCPNLRTLHKAITDPKGLHSQSKTFDAHDKSPEHQRHYAMYMAENFRFRMNPLQDYVYCTQFLQAEAMSYAYNCWKREFHGPGEENCSGVLVWQLISGRVLARRWWMWICIASQRFIPLNTPRPRSW